MSNKNDDFDFDDFLMYKTITGGGCGGCLITAISIIGVMILVLIMIF